MAGAVRAGKGALLNSPGNRAAPVSRIRPSLKMPERLARPGQGQARASAGRCAILDPIGRVAPYGISDGRLRRTGAPGEVRAWGGGASGLGQGAVGGHRGLRLGKGRGRGEPRAIRGTVQGGAASGGAPAGRSGPRRGAGEGVCGPGAPGRRSAAARTVDHPGRDGLTRARGNLDRAIRAIRPQSRSPQRSRRRLSDNLDGSSR